MSGAVLEREPIAPTENERSALDNVYAELFSEPKQQAALVGPSGERIELPESLFRVLCQAVDVLRMGGAVTVAPHHTEFTTQEAADFLNVSRQYLVRLLIKGDIPFTKVGTHRRVRLGDVVDYREKRDVDRRDRLDKLTQLSQELGLYN